jgi:hypothetical protein
MEMLRVAAKTANPYFVRFASEPHTSVDRFLKQNPTSSPYGLEIMMRFYMPWRCRFFIGNIDAACWLHSIMTHCCTDIGTKAKGCQYSECDFSSCFDNDSTIHFLLF